MAAVAQALFMNNFLAPTTETWNDIKNGTMKSFTKDDFTHSIWNSILCTAPMVVGGTTAYFMNSLIHKMIQKKFPLKNVISLISTTASVVVGTGVSFFAIKFLAANRITVDSFSAEKIVKLEALAIVPIMALSPLYYYLDLYKSLAFYPALLPFFTIGAFAGYFGQRSLYVIGAISALSGAIQAAMVTSFLWKLKDVVDTSYERLDPDNI